jgi:hypothetical protein
MRRNEKNYDATAWVAEPEVEKGLLALDGP